MKKSTKLILSIMLIVVFALSSLGLTSIPVKSIKLNTTSFSIPAGKTFILKASITPDNATNKKLIFTSGNKSIATVDKNGLIKGVKSGKTIITVAASNGVRARCSVTIEALKQITVTVGQWAFFVTIDKPDLVANDPIIKYLENKFKMKFKWEAYGPDNYNQYFSLRLATGNLPDLFETQLWPVIQDNWSEWRNITLDMRGMVQENPSRYPIMNDVFKDKNYRFANSISNFDINDYHAILLANTAKKNVSGGVPAYNKKFLDNLNRTFPKTTDEFISLLRAFVNNDPDKNGKKDTGGICLPYYAGNNLFLELDPLFFRTNGTYANGLHQDKNGNWYDAAIATVNKPIWKLLAQLFAEGVFDKEYITRTGVGAYEEGFNTGTFGAISERLPNGPSASQYNFYKAKYIKANPQATYKDMPMQPTPLVGPKGDQVSKDVIEWSVSWKIMSSKVTKAPERILDLVEYLMFSYEGNVLKNCGIKGVHYTIDAGGNIIVNKEKFRKEIAELYYPTEPNRLQWMPFFRGSNAGQEFVDYPKYKNNWLEANKNGVWYSSTLSPKTEEFDYYAELNNKYAKSDYFNFLPAYYWAANGFIPKSDMDKYNSIVAKQLDIAKEYLNAFFSNKYSVDEKWDEYVSKYKAADPDNFIISTWTKAFNIAKQKYDDAN